MFSPFSFAFLAKFDMSLPWACKTFFNANKLLDLHPSDMH